MAISVSISLGVVNSLRLLISQCVCSLSVSCQFNEDQSIKTNTYLLWMAFVRKHALSEPRLSASMYGN